MMSGHNRRVHTEVSSIVLSASVVIIATVRRASCFGVFSLKTQQFFPHYL